MSAIKELLKPTKDRFATARKFLGYAAQAATPPIVSSAIERLRFDRTATPKEKRLRKHIETSILAPTFELANLAEQIGVPLLKGEGGRGVDILGKDRSMLEFPKVKKTLAGISKMGAKISPVAFPGLQALQKPISEAVEKIPEDIFAETGRTGVKIGVALGLGVGVVKGTQAIKKKHFGDVKDIIFKDLKEKATKAGMPIDKVEGYSRVETNNIMSGKRTLNPAYARSVRLRALKRFEPIKGEAGFAGIGKGKDSKLQPLIQEAKKFKTPEEFISRQGIKVLHGTGTKFETFDDSMRGSLTGAKSAKGAIWFTDDPATAKAYSVYSAETGVVKKALDEADRLEKIAQKSGKSSDWDKQNAKLLEAEQLDTYEKTFERRAEANVKEVVIKGDLYEIDAQGKSPQELSSEGDIDSWLDEQITEAKKIGKAGLKITNLDDAVGLYNRPATHYAIFDSKNIKTKSQLTDTWKQAQEAIPAPKVPTEGIVAPIKPIAEPIIKKPTVTETLEQRIQKIKEQFKRPETITRKEVKAVQEELIRRMETSNLEAKDKAKFIKAIKNIQTPQQFEKTMDDFMGRVRRVQTQTKKANIGATIKKELTKTKPVKAGQRIVGKYDYESNKFFEEVRGHSKLNQTKAQESLDTMPTENLTQLDLIKTRILSLQANGASASLEIYQQVLNDIKTLKELGSAAKDDADFEKHLARNERVEAALLSMDKVKGGSNVLTVVRDGYLKGWGNIHSMYNAVFGKTFADTYNPELAESQRNTNIYYKTKEVSNAAAKIYGEKHILKVFENMSRENFELTDIEGLDTKISRIDLIDIYNSLKNPAVEKRYYDAFGEDQIKGLMSKLTQADIDFADMMQKSVQGYRPVLNERNIEITGRDLGFVENYWPATSEYQANVYDDIRMQGETPSAMKERAKGKVIPKPTNAWHKFGRHVAQAEHVANVSREYEELKRMLTDRRVKHAIEKKFGEDIYRTMLAQLENISLNAQMATIDAISGFIGKALNSWIKAKLPSPTILVRQLMSVGNYMEVMPVATWTGLYLQGITSPKATFDFMWKNAPFLEARFHKGYKEALSRAIDDAEKMSVGWSNWTMGLTAMVRAGDISAIIYGGYPLVKYEMAQGKSLEEAVKIFELATLRAQQSGLSSSLSQFQNSKNPMARLFLAFKNTSNQYLRKMVDATISFSNEDIDSLQYGKTMTIYGLIQPILYILAGWGVKEGMKKVGQLVRGEQEDTDWDNLFDDIMMQILVNPFNAIPIFDGVLKFAMRKSMGKKAYNVLSMPMLDDIETAVRKATKKEPTFGDFMDAAGTAIEIGTSFPALTFKRFYTYVMPKKKGNIKSLLKRKKSGNIKSLLKRKKSNNIKALLR